MFGDNTGFCENRRIFNNVEIVTEGFCGNSGDWRIFPGYQTIGLLDVILLISLSLKVDFTVTNKMLVKKMFYSVGGGGNVIKLSTGVEQCSQSEINVLYIQ